jgi:hypothetical protein
MPKCGDAASKPFIPGYKKTRGTEVPRASIKRRHEGVFAEC